MKCSAAVIHAVDHINLGYQDMRDGKNLRGVVVHVGAS